MPKSIRKLINKKDLTKDDKKHIKKLVALINKIGTKDGI